jgi:hypothetical protein
LGLWLRQRGGRNIGLWLRLWLWLDWGSRSDFGFHMGSIGVSLIGAMALNLALFGDLALILAFIGYTAGWL